MLDLDLLNVKQKFTYNNRYEINLKARIKLFN